MRSQPFRYTTCRRNHVHIFVAVVFAGERDHGSVGRKHRVDFDAHIAGEATCVATTAVHNPQITTVTESDLHFAHRGLSKERITIRGLRRQFTGSEKEYNG